MAFTVADFHDSIRLLEEHTNWRTELRRVLFSQDLLGLPRTVHELATSQRRTEEAVTPLTERLEQGIIEATTKRQELRQELTRHEERGERGFTEATVERLGLRLGSHSANRARGQDNRLRRARSYRACREPPAHSHRHGAGLRRSRCRAARHEPGYRPTKGTGPRIALPGSSGRNLWALSEARIQCHQSGSGPPSKGPPDRCDL